MRHVFGEPYTVKLQPEGIEIFGNWYTSPSVQKLYRDLPAELARYSFSPVFATPVRKAVHGDSSGVRGAAWL